MFHQHLHIAVDVAQRRPQIVGNGIRECFQLLVRCFELGCALADALFQLGIKPANLAFGLDPFGDVADGHHGQQRLPVSIMDQSASVAENALPASARTPDAEIQVP